MNKQVVIVGLVVVAIIVGMASGEKSKSDNGGQSKKIAKIGENKNEEDNSKATVIEEKRDHFAEVKPILQHFCLKCHSDNNGQGNYKENGNLRMETEAFALAGGNMKSPIYKKGDPEGSLMWAFMNLPRDNKLAMPPKKFGVGMREDQKKTVYDWIKAGAPWPEGERLEFRLLPRKIIMPTELYKQLGFDKAKKFTGEMKPFVDKIPGTNVSFSMTPIPAGQFKMGSPDSDSMKQDDELPQHDVKIDAFWMSQYETTWNQYVLWQFDKEIELRLEMEGYKTTQADENADIVSRPTPPYHGMSFGMDTDQHPAICMTQLAAKCYCMWLSAKTGRFYRLPTEAEWEYACRAGTQTVYFFGNEPNKLGEYAWYEGNNKDPYHYHPVGKKKPNPWKLYDMLGNVSEWVLDSYSSYKPLAGKLNVNPIRIPTTEYPRVVRGGSWDDDPDALRCAARLGSDKEWKMQDPQIPQSVWYHTEAKWAGMRVVCMPNPPSLKDLHKYWPTDEEIKAIPKR